MPKNLNKKVPEVVRIWSESDRRYHVAIGFGVDLVRDYWYGWESQHCVSGPFRSMERAETWLKTVRP